MIDISKIQYETVLLTADGSKVRLSEIMQNVSWEDNPGELAQRATTVFRNQAYAGKWITSFAKPGAQIFIYSDWGTGMKEVFHGPIWIYNYDSAVKKDLQLTVYDNLIYQQRSKDYRWYKAGTSSKEVILDIFNDWGIPIGTYNGPDVALAKKVFKGTTIADMILEVLDDSKKKGAGQFVARSTRGNAEIVPRGSNSEIYVFTADNSAISTNEQISLEDLVTRVKIIGKEDKEEKAPVEAVIDGKTEFGILQDIVQRNQDDSLSTAKQSAQEILNEKGEPKWTAKVQAPDLPFLRKGDKIKVDAGSLGGYYFVKGVQHDATNRTMTMEVEV